VLGYFLSSLEYFKNLHSTIDKLDHNDFDNCSSIIANYINKNNKILSCGNGGSASTASHYITDWVKMSLTQNKHRLDAICLSDNIGMLTAYGNDFNYDSVFSEQVRSYGRKNDLLICVSGSGNSLNLLQAVDTAKDIGLKSMAIVGYDGGELIKKCDYSVHIPSFDMQICEDLHLSFGHVVMQKICKS
jgi:D-sedoheptulose 7-phosphate isomerase